CGWLYLGGRAQRNARLGEQRCDPRLRSLAPLVEHGELPFESGNFQLRFQHILLKAFAYAIAIPCNLLETAEQIAGFSREFDGLVQREPFVVGDLQTRSYVENDGLVFLPFALSLALRFFRRER